jgi:integrase
MRSGEIRALRWGDLDLKAGWATVARRASWVAGEKRWDVGPPKSGNGRRLPLAPDALDALRRWPHTLGTDLVFPGPDGGFRHDWMARNALQAAMKAAGVEGEARPHDFRHTFASHLLATGADVETVRRLGGWSTLAMVLRYVHTGEAAMAAAVARLAAGA